MAQIYGAANPLAALFKISCAECLKLWRSRLVIQPAPYPHFTVEMRIGW
jgi:hypothetical protein